MENTVHNLFLKYCFNLSKNGFGLTSPNPSVGAVLVVNKNIIGQGFTSPYGGSHAEVNCIKSVKKENKHLIPLSTLYVSLEPCCHYGNTPPCTKAIIEAKIKKVVVACIDSNEKVKGKGISILKKNKITVLGPFLEEEAKFINRRFLTFQSKKRPYIILKWAQSADGFIQSKATPKKNNISNLLSKQLVHLQRTKEDAILIGTTTAIADNPMLNVRHCAGKQPKRFVLDLNNRLPKTLNLFNNQTPTYVFCCKKNKYPNAICLLIKKEKELYPQLMKHFYNLKINSIIIEGGKKTLNYFISNNNWDEAHIYESKNLFYKGLKAPMISGYKKDSLKVNHDTLTIFSNVN